MIVDSQPRVETDSRQEVPDRVRDPDLNVRNFQLINDRRF